MHRILFTIFCIIYVLVVENYFYHHVGIASGILLIISGTWGLVTKQMLFKTGYSRKVQAIIVNIIIGIIGMGITVYFLVQ